MNVDNTRSALASVAHTVRSFAATSTEVAAIAAFPFGHVAALRLKKRGAGVSTFKRTSGR